LPEPKHLAADRYLDGLSPEAREDLIKRYLPDLYRPDGGTGIIGSPEECHRLMLRWEETFSSSDFQKKKKGTGLFSCVRSVIILFVLEKSVVQKNLSLILPI